MSVLRSILAFAAAAIGLILLAPVVLVGMAFWGVAGATRLVARLIRPSYQHDSELYEFDPELGWKPRPHLDTRYLARGGDVCRLRTDSEGWAGRCTLDESEVVTFGDSFVFGYGVDSEASFTELRPDLRVKPLGTSGYNMAQGVILMRQVAPRLRGKLVIWFLCLDNDLYDNLRPNKPNYYRSPFVRPRIYGDEARWEIVTDHIQPAPWTVSSHAAEYERMLARLCTPCAISRRTYSACRHLIDEANEVCRTAGARLVVATIPNKNQLSAQGIELLTSHLLRPEERADLDPDYPDLQIGSLCRELGIPFSAGKEFLAAAGYKHNDTHWTPEGHRRAARWLARIVRAEQKEFPIAPNSLGPAQRSADPHPYSTAT